MGTDIPAPILRRLADLQLFTGCTRQELREIARYGTVIHRPAGTVFTREGQPAKEFFLVLAGTATCSINGKRVRAFGPGEFFGEVGLLDKGPRTATVVADGPIEIAVFSLPEFTGMVQSCPTVTKHLLSALAERLRDTDTSLGRAYADYDV